MIGMIDIVSFCKILTDLTNKDKCHWKQTPQISRDRLEVESGYIDITLFEEPEKKYYSIEMFPNNNEQCVPFVAIKGIDEVEFKVYGDLYKSIWDYYTRIRNKQLNVFYNEIMDITSK